MKLVSETLQSLPKDSLATFPRYIKWQLMEDPIYILTSLL